MGDPRHRTPDEPPRRTGDEDEGPRVQHGADDPSRAEPPADPDRPTDDVKQGNTFVEPAPGD